MLISVIVTTCNSSAYISKALNGLVNQTYKNFEVIIVDDASEDIQELYNVIGDYNKSLQIKIYGEKIKSNASNTRNIGIKHALGDIICFHDADDIWFKEKLDTVNEFFEGNDVNEPILMFHSCIRGSYSSIDKKKYTIVPEKKLIGKNVIDYLFNEGGVIQTSTISINKSAASILNFDNSLIRHQDIQFCIDAYIKNVSFKFLDVPLSYWVILNENITAVTKGADIEFCKTWLKKNHNILSVENKKNYCANTLCLIGIKQGRYLETFRAIYSITDIHTILYCMFKLTQYAVKKIIRPLISQ